MDQLFYFEKHPALAGLTLAETRELKFLERRNPSFAEWDPHTLQPISDQEKRWAYLSQKYVDATQRPNDPMIETPAACALHLAAGQAGALRPPIQRAPCARMGMRVLPPHE
jgi:hypothetical protein